ncbi:polyphosphate kinase 1 [Aquimarina brevivitae]|uniref:Polyphosphate kinase n=1 Tax=Aquimarina brevivitae TaxID=323412 RepID=A0A4Q7NUP8_9FLAO|nr:polyphosphate kinase 1 [Aquimarina brevivitae]RZS90660.1 polyphosphate kinase [Aquimarina brevivitae]
MRNKQIPLLNRDINWLSFNKRVLQEAEDTKNPLFERLRFLAIYSSNLDEFFRVRVARLRQIKSVDKKIRKKLALKPSKEVKKIVKIVKKQLHEFGVIFNTKIIPELASNGIYILSEKKFTDPQKAFAKAYFNDSILPYLTVNIIDLSQEATPFLQNNKLYFVVIFDQNDKVGIVNIPVDHLGRFIQFPTHHGKHYIAFIDDLIQYNIQQVFNDVEVKMCYQIKLSRDAQLYIEDEFKGELADQIKESLSKRITGQPTRLLYDASMPENLVKKIRKLFGLGKIDMVPGGQYHNFSDFFSFPDPTDNQTLHFSKEQPIIHNNFTKPQDLFQLISKRDQLLHFPYMSFDHVQDFIALAATDRHTTEIKISLYRIAEESALTSALLTALANGKKVTVFVEVKARFDEKNNLKWGEILANKGAEVHYSYPKIKVHSKILLVHRIENNKEVSYGYIGTGNFNAKTAKIYCDHGLFTKDERVTKELQLVFDILSGSTNQPSLKHLTVSPYTTRLQFNTLIDREIENAGNGRIAFIKAKLNSLEDPEIISKLYEASKAGVTIKLVVRGFCCLVPNDPIHSKNIKAISIVDRYLEHGRIYSFANGGKIKTFIGSADWMVRNLDKRIEVLTPIYNQDLKEELNTILDLQLADNVKARLHDDMGLNRYVRRKNEDKKIRSQKEIRTFLKTTHKVHQLLTK